MLLTIFNFPAKTRYHDIKSLIHNKCGFKDVILDNLSLIDDNSKKVTVGLAEEEDAAILVRKMNGLYFEGRHLYVETVTKKQENQHNDLYKSHARSAYESGVQMRPVMPGPQNTSNIQARNFMQPTLQQPYYQQNSYQQPGYQPAYSDMQHSSPSVIVPTQLSHAGIYRASNDQNAFANYGYPQQMPYQSTSQVKPQPLGAFAHGAPLGFNNQGNNSGSWSNQNDWKLAGNQNSQQSSGSSRWNNSRDSNSRLNRDAPYHDHRRDAPSYKYERDAPPRDHAPGALSRGRSRDAPARAHARDVSLRERGRESRARVRQRGAPGPHHARADPPGNQRRDAPYRSNDHERAPPKQTFSSYDAPAKSSTSYPKIYGDHVTNPLHRTGKISYKPEPSDNVPPAKRSRQGLGFGKYSSEPKPNVPVNKNKFTAPTKKNKLKNNPETLIHRATTWRCQIAASLAREIINNSKCKNDIDPELFLTELKRGIRYRLETMFGDNLELRMVDMLRMYRDVYDTSSDEDFYKEVTVEIKKHGSYLADDVQTAVPDDPEKEEDRQELQQEPQQAPPGDIKKIPSYPQGDKRLNKLQKIKNLGIFKDEDTLISKLNPSMQKVLDENVDEICSLITEEFSENPEPTYKNFHERIKTTVVKDLKTALKLNITKRILNEAPIMLRIFNIPKMISRGKLAPILAQYGVTSLRKSEKNKYGMYIGTCATYEEHDKLCSMKPIVIDDSTVTIKPFQLVGQKEKLSKEQYKMQRINIARRYADSGEKNLDEEGEADEDIGEQADETDQDIMEVDNNDNGETGDNKDTNENDREQQEMNDGDKNTDIEKTKTVKTESNNEESNDKNNSKLVEEHVACEVKCENSTSVVDKLEEKESSIKPKEIKGNVDETNHVKDDLPAEKKDSIETKDTGNDSLEMDTEPSDIKPEILDDFEGHKDYEDIDIDDVHEDDLEDWV